MGFLKRIFGGKEVVVDPAHLTLPEVMPTDKGTTMRKAPGDQRVDINIVGESFRARNVQAVATAAQGNRFDIYLQPDPNNPHDKKAVAVFAADVCIGYIAKPSNKQWYEWAVEAFARGELLCGSAKASSREGSSDIGIFGYINMPKVGKGLEEIIPQQLTDAALAKAVEKVITLANASVEPDTVARIRSLCKKAVTAVSPIAAHAKWITQQGEDNEQWAEILSVCDDIFEDALRATYITDEYEIDVVGPIEQLGELLAALKQGGGE
jgi:hypothetical protein